MGHTWLGTLYATRRWKDVIGLVAEGADAARVAEAVSHAWTQAFNTIKEDAGFREAVWLMTQFGVAGRVIDPVEHLSSVGVEIRGATSVVEVAMALSEALERRMGQPRARTDFGELAQRALVSAVAEHLQRDISPMLGGREEEVVGAVMKCGREKEFGKLSRDFFGRLTNGCLDYFLSKTLPAQVGPKQAFTTMRQWKEFDLAMKQHCRESAEIVEAYSGGWLSKHHREEGGQIGRESAEGFGWYGLEKMRRELEVRARA